MGVVFEWAVLTLLQKEEKTYLPAKLSAWDMMTPAQRAAHFEQLKAREKARELVYRKWERRIEWLVLAVGSVCLGGLILFWVGGVLFLGGGAILRLCGDFIAAPSFPTMRAALFGLFIPALFIFLFWPAFSKAKEPTPLD